MTHRPWSVLPALAIALGLCFTAAQPAQSSDDEDHDRRVHLTGSHDSEQLVAGSRLIIDAKVGDDVIAAGGRVIVAGADAVDFLLAGGRLELRDISFVNLTAAAGKLEIESGIGEDAILAGGEVEIALQLSDDLIVAGGEVEVDASTRIGGTAYLSGGEIEMDGAVQGDLHAGAGRIEITGSIGGDAHLFAEEVVLAGGSTIAGDLYIGDDSELRREPGSSIGGNIVTKEGRGFEPPSLATLIAGAVAAAGLGFAMLIVLLAVIQLIAPRLVRTGGDLFNERPWAALGLGFAVLVGAPIAASLLFATVVGAALAAVALAAYFVVATLGFAAAADRIGRWIVDRFAAPVRPLGALPGFWRRLGQVALGLILLIVLAIVPLVGWLAASVLVMMGLGALILAIAEETTVRGV